MELPNDVKSILDGHINELKIFLGTCKEGYRSGYNVRQFPWLKNYFIKYEVDRVSNANKLRHIIKEHKLDLLTVPDKYLYHISGQPLEIVNGNYVVVAKKCQGRLGYGACINLEQVRQLYKVCKYTPYYAMVTNNYIILPNGKIAIIDTDNEAMPNSDEISHLHSHWLQNGDSALAPGGGIYTNPEIINTPFCRFRIAMYSKWNNYNGDAMTYLSNKLSKYENSRITYWTRYLIRSLSYINYGSG